MDADKLEYNVHLLRCPALLVLQKLSSDRSFSPVQYTDANHCLCPEADTELQRFHNLQKLHYNALPVHAVLQGNDPVFFI